MFLLSWERLYCKYTAVHFLAAFIALDVILPISSCFLGGKELTMSFLGLGFSSTYDNHSPLHKYTIKAPHVESYNTLHINILYPRVSNTIFSIIHTYVSISFPLEREFWFLKICHRYLKDQSLKFLYGRGVDNDLTTRLKVCARPPLKASSIKRCGFGIARFQATVPHQLRLSTSEVTTSNYTGYCSSCSYSCSCCCHLRISIHITQLISTKHTPLNAACVWRAVGRCEYANPWTTDALTRSKQMGSPGTPDSSLPNRLWMTALVAINLSAYPLRRGLNKQNCYFLLERKWPWFLLALARSIFR